MPALSRVVENEVYFDGTIKTKAKVSAGTVNRAETKAIKATLRHNGLTDLFLTSSRHDVEVDKVAVVDEGIIGLRKMYLVEVTIVGTDTIE